jgi:biopolymer transport protein ExbB
MHPMHITGWLKDRMLGIGDSWVLWLLVGLSLSSIAIALERAYFYWFAREQSPWLRRLVAARLESNDVAGALDVLESSRSVEAAVGVAGLLELERGAEAAEEAMSAARALVKMALERRLAFLGTLGNNAPFIGLFGTVIGVVHAFDALGSTVGAAPERVMGAIAGALVATAAGLAVAVPAVALYNFFQRVVKDRLAQTEALMNVIKCWLATMEPPGADMDMESFAEEQSA